MSLTTEQQQCLAVTALHNHGVALLQKDQHRQAHKAFVESLKRLKETLQFTSSTSRHEESSSNRPSCFVRHALQVASETACHVPLQLFAYVYSFPTVAISSSSTSSILSDPTSYHNRDGSAAVMFFNLAVTHHTRGLQLMESNAKAARICFAKALQFYHNALSAVQEWARRVVAPHDGIHELRLAILNNMAHAQALLGQQSAAHHSLTCLRDILRCGGSKSCRGVPRSHLKFFATNLMVVFCLDDSPPRRRHHVIPNDDDDDAMAEEEPTTAAKTSSFAECVPPAAAA